MYFFIKIVIFINCVGVILSFGGFLGFFFLGIFDDLGIF